MNKNINKKLHKNVKKNDLPQEDGEAMHIQWFPGHMTKTRRLIEANLKLVDAVVEILDSRVVISSKNPEMDKMIGNKPKMIILNKADSADENVTSQWISYYKEKDVVAIATDCRSGKGVNKFIPALQDLLKNQIESWQKKGMVGRPIRIMIVGIPNVGKSSFINKIAKSKRAKVEDRPGVTRGKQWVTLEKGLELLDMPGILWPKFEDKIVGEHLAFTGAVKDDILDIEYLALRLLELLNLRYSSRLSQRYSIDTENDEKGFDILEKIAKKRGFLLSGGSLNTERAVITVLDEFRGGKIGRISLEKPE